MGVSGHCAKNDWYKWKGGCDKSPRLNVNNIKFMGNKFRGKKVSTRSSAILKMKAGWCN